MVVQNFNCLTRHPVAIMDPLEPVLPILIGYIFILLHFAQSLMLKIFKIVFFYYLPQTIKRIKPKKLIFF